jgi:hypothetical protein
MLVIHMPPKIPTFPSISDGHRRTVANGLSGWAIFASNLQPSGYEHRAPAGMINKYWHFRARWSTNVRVWLRRFIGYLLVGVVTPLCIFTATLIAHQFTDASIFHIRAALLARATG